jgi:hypothetical protein
MRADRRRHGLAQVAKNRRQPDAIERLVRSTALPLARECLSSLLLDRLGSECAQYHHADTARSLQQSPRFSITDRRRT